MVVEEARITSGISPINCASQTFSGQPNGGLILPTDTFTQLRQELIADTASRNHLPSISAQSDFAKYGGLMCYSGNVNLIDQFRQATNYVDRILKGARAGDLPVQRADKYTFSINLKTAEALGLTVLLPLLGLADEVIE
jgi:putative tryptophan/tyrosine transport system substrate-binding protein